MDIIELIKEAATTLFLNKMRTGLAILGIVIGIGSVITLVSLGQGSQQAIANQIQSLGSNLITIIPGSPRNEGGLRGAGGTGVTLTLADAQAIESALVPHMLTHVSAELTSRGQISVGRNNTNSTTNGVQESYAQVHNVQVSSGRFISQSDVASMARVAVIGPTTATNLFEENDPIGQTIKIDGQQFTIIGVTATKGGAGFNNPDDALFIPLSTAQKQLFGRDYVSAIAVQVVDKDQMVPAQDALGYLLLNRHKLKTPTDADFSFFSQNDILNTVSQTTNTFTMLLGGIAAISLLVGGIGIMNIMLVTVTERTREIGLRKAIGAPRNVIIAQFLIEAIMLTVVGGAAGILLGVALSYIITSLISIPFALSTNSIALALGVSGAIGIVFGWYPARRAANLAPIVALRYE